MKNYILLTCLSAVLSGCIVLPSHSGSTPDTLVKGVKTVENSKAVTRTVTRGSLLCEGNAGCPELAIDWEKQHGKYDLSIHIYSPQQINLNEFTFIIDGKKSSYSVIGSTSFRHLPNSDVIDSSNTVQVPESLLSQFKHANTIQIELSTSQGDITHTMLDNGRQSDAYRLFLRAY